MAQHRTMTTQFIDGEPDGLRLCNCVGSLITTVYMPRSRLARARQLDLPSRGIYYLLRVDGLDVTRLYVGQTTQGVNRLNDHNQKKPWWDRAILFLSDDSNNFTLDTVSGLEKYAIERAMETCPDIDENKVAPKYKITKFQRPFIESLYGEVQFMMASFGLRVTEGTVPAHDASKRVEPLAEELPTLIATPDDSAPISVTMTKRKVTVKGLYDPATDVLTVLAGARIDLAAAVMPKDRATVSKRNDLMNGGKLTDNDDGTGTLLVDLPLPSPTAAAQFVFGGSINGRKYWKVEDGNSVRDVWGPRASATTTHE